MEQVLKDSCVCLRYPQDWHFQATAVAMPWRLPNRRPQYPLKPLPQIIHLATVVKKTPASKRAATFQPTADLAAPRCDIVWQLAPWFPGDGYRLATLSARPRA